MSNKSVISLSHYSHCRDDHGRGHLFCISHGRREPTHTRPIHNDTNEWMWWLAAATWLSRDRRCV